MEGWAKESHGPNSLKAEHLKEGVRPIMACVGSAETYASDLEPLKKRFEDGNPDVDNVDFYGDVQVQQEQGYKNAGKQTYLISPIDSHDKVSRRFYNCTGLVVASIDKETGENISFVTHQAPGSFLLRNNLQFAADIEERLDEMRKRSVDGSVDAVVVGGNYDYMEEGEGAVEEYLDALKLLTADIERMFGFKPVIIRGPKAYSGSEDLYYENNNRRVFLVQPREDNKGRDFTYSEPANSEFWNSHSDPRTG